MGRKSEHKRDSHREAELKHKIEQKREHEHELKKKLEREREREEELERKREHKLKEEQKCERELKKERNRECKTERELKEEQKKEHNLKKKLRHEKKKHDSSSSSCSDRSKSTESRDSKCSKKSHSSRSSSSDSKCSKNSKSSRSSSSDSKCSRNSKHSKESKCSKSTRSSSNDSKCSRDSKDSRCERKWIRKNKHLLKCIRKLDECELTEQLKRRLIEDPDMMVEGSKAYAAMYSKVPQSVVIGQAVTFDNHQIVYNIDHTPGDSEVYVRKTGLYAFNFVIESAQAIQFTAYVNGVNMNITTVGKGSGAGILNMRGVLDLKNGDSLTFRNWQSAIGSITSNENPGGVASGTNVSLILYYIAPSLAKIECNEDNRENEKETDLIFCDRRLKKLFECVLNKMMCDKGLMLAGVDAMGVFYKKQADTVALEAPITFEYDANVSCLTHAPGSSTIVVKKSGVYRMDFTVSLTKSGQFALFVNNVPVDGTITGIFQGASEIVVRYILSLNANDQLTLVNHTSLIGTVQLAHNPGGITTATYDGINVSLILDRIAPNKCDMQYCEPKPNCFYSRKNCKWNLIYELYKHYVLINRKLMPAGADALIETQHRSAANFKLNAPLILPVNTLDFKLKHKTGTGDFIICKDGFYKYTAEFETQEPTQLTIFVNGVANLATTFGSDSGASQGAANNILKLCKGDCVQVRNAWSVGSSVDNSIDLDVNPGGNYVANNLSVSFKRIAPPCW
ncbi:hypothetical protein BMW23_0139 [Bodo saltans virus]|uniref:BclA C-terminal domain-containing protein n=1 Tax=Bodo saltans virus TaxID=2024608 RepID=A0A2H4UTI3_9VIRU|nr:hypothetical protein QJ851_gp0135 [Bodo saltans virus]ATZ80198.1 hypothetical protein BMW23_0139 [Bodo saltans virus]